MHDSIFKNNSKKGVYYGKRCDENGKIGQFSLGTKNKKKAKIKFRQVMSDLWKSELYKNEKIYLISDVCTDYIALKLGEGIGDDQKSEIESSFRLLKVALGDASIKDITAMKAEKFIKLGWNGENGWGKKKEASLSTKRKHLYNLRAGFRMAVRWEWIKTNPFSGITLPKSQEQDPEFLTLEEFTFLRESMPVGKFHQIRLKQIVEIAFHTGLRLSELLTLEESNIDYSRNLILIRKKPGFKPKWGRERDVPMNQYTITALRSAIIQNKASTNPLIVHSTFFFPSSTGKGLSKNNISRQFKDHIRNVFPTRPGLHFHSLRHSYGVFQCERGVPLQIIQKLMGHGKISTTEIYARMRQSVAISSYEEFERKEKQEMQTTIPIQTTEMQRNLLLLQQFQKFLGVNNKGVDLGQFLQTSAPEGLAPFNHIH